MKTTAKKTCGRNRPEKTFQSSPSISQNFYERIFDKEKDIPKWIREPRMAPETDTPSTVYDCREIHHDSRKFPFPLVPPDYFCNDGKKANFDPPNGEIVGEDGFFQVTDDDECRRMYQANRKSRPEVWYSHNRRYCPGAIYKKVDGRFFKVPMLPPTYDKKSKKWKVDKVRLRVAILDEEDKDVGHTYVEVSHMPLVQVSSGQTEGFAMHLKKNIQSHMPNSRGNVRTNGDALGAMSSGGVKREGVIKPYVPTPPAKQSTAFMQSAKRFFNKYGFRMWLRLLRERMVDIGPLCYPLPFGKTPFCSLNALTINFANEAHYDTNDECPGFAIWHSNHAYHPRSPTKNHAIENWYFLFPDMQIFVNGEWHNGVAIPIFPGTAVAWDGRLLRHCTALPSPKIEGAQAWANYFGIHKDVASLGRKNMEERKVKMEEERRMRLVLYAKKRKAQNMEKVNAERPAVPRQPMAFPGMPLYQPTTYPGMSCYQPMTYPGMPCYQPMTFPGIPCNQPMAFPGMPHYHQMGHSTNAIPPVMPPYSQNPPPIHSLQAYYTPNPYLHLQNHAWGS